MRPLTKLQAFANFWPKKMLQPFITPRSLQNYLHQTTWYFLFPKLKMKLKGLHFAGVAEIQKAVADELKKVKKKNFRQLFRNCTTAQKLVYMPVEIILN